jgi:ferredoxin-type protein NapH
MAAASTGAGEDTNAGEVSTRKRNPRLVALRVLREEPHRYVRVRRLTLAVTVVLLYAVPLSGLAQVDLVRGQHMAAFAPVPIALPAVMSMVITAVCFWVSTLALATILGRVFCGFGCLVSQSSRLADYTESAENTGRALWRARLTQLGVALLFGGGITLWWVDEAVLWLGTPLEIAGALGIYALVTAGVVLHGRYWRWGFCKQLCPIGLYYSIVGHDTPRFGVRFDAAKCNECRLCDKACPVGLEPRDLTKTVKDAGGLAFDFLPAANHCLVCGDCVRACGVALSKQSFESPALQLRFGERNPGAKREGSPRSSSVPPPAPELDGAA